MLLGIDTSHPEFWNLSKTDQRPTESARKSISNTGSIYRSLEENKSFLRGDTGLGFESLEHPKRRTRGFPSLSRAEAVLIRSSPTRTTVVHEIVQKRSTSSLKSHDNPDSTPPCLQYLRPVTPGVREMDLWSRNPSVSEPSSQHGNQHGSQQWNQRVSDVSPLAPQHDDQATSSPSKRSMKFDIRKLFSRQRPFTPITASPAQTMHIPTSISRNNQNLQFAPLASSLTSRSASPPGTGGRRPGSIRRPHSKESLGNTGTHQGLQQMSYQSSGEHPKIHVRRPPRGAKEWFDALSDDDDDNDDIITHKTNSKMLLVPITILSDQLNDKVPCEQPPEIAKARGMSIYAEELELLEAGKPVTSPRGSFARKSSDTISTSEMDSMVRNSLISSGKSPGERTSTSTKNSTNKKTSIRPRMSFQEGQSILALSDSDESDFPSVRVVYEAACANVTLTGRPKMVRRKQKQKGDSGPRSPSYTVHDILTTRCLVENDSSTSSNYRSVSSAPTTADPNTSARTSWISNVQTGFPAESSPSGKIHPPGHMAQIDSVNTPQEQGTAQQTAHYVGTGSHQRLMAVTQEEAHFLASMRRKRAVVENQIFTADFKSGIEQELRKLEQLQAQALSTLELSREITEVQRMLDPARTNDQRQRQYFSGYRRVSSIGTTREVTVENDHEHEHEPRSVSVQTAEFPNPPRARPLRKSQESAGKPATTPTQPAPRPSSVPPRPSMDTAKESSLESNTPPSIPTPPPPAAIPATRLRKPKKRASYPYKLFPDTTTTTPSPGQVSMPLQHSLPTSDAMPRQFSMSLQHSLPTPDATPRASLSASVLAPG